MIYPSYNITSLQFLSKFILLPFNSGSLVVVVVDVVVVDVVVVVAVVVVVVLVVEVVDVVFSGSSVAVLSSRILDTLHCYVQKKTSSN